MPNRDKTGPGVKSTGPRDGIGEGHGFHTNEKGTGKQTGGNKGDCE